MIFFLEFVNIQDCVSRADFMLAGGQWFIGMTKGSDLSIYASVSLHIVSVYLFESLELLDTEARLPGQWLTERTQ